MTFKKFLNEGNNYPTKEQRRDSSEMRDFSKRIVELVHGLRGTNFLEWRRKIFEMLTSEEKVKWNSLSDKEKDSLFNRATKEWK